MPRTKWNTLLALVQDMHQAHDALTDFCPFPTDISPQDVEPFSVPSADLLRAETGLYTDRYAQQRDAFVAAGEIAHWRETYRDTDIGDDFMTRFGCYCLIGDGGAFASAQMWAWVVYMPAGLHYPWHHHPAEEMYLTLAGSAEFHRAGDPPLVLRAGETSQHASNQPHAMETTADPVMAYVVWRNGFDVPPVLTVQR